MSGSPLQSSIASVAAREAALAEVQTAAAGGAAGTITPAAPENAVADLAAEHAAYLEHRVVRGYVEALIRKPVRLRRT
jgi:hypothetical protein